MSWLILLFAILCEVAGTIALKISEGMTRLWPTVLMFVFYLISLGALSLALRRIPVSVAYAVWSGLGTVIIAAIGIYWFKEDASMLKLVSMGVVILGIIGLNLSGVER